MTLSWSCGEFTTSAMEKRLQSCYRAQNKTNGPHSRDVMSNQSKKPGLSDYFKALRPWSFTASVTPVALGFCLACKSQDVFSVPIFLTTLVTVLCVHSAGNLINTYMDFIKGVDDKRSDDRTLVDNILMPANVRTLALAFYATACIGLILLIFLSPAKPEHLIFIFCCGLSSSYLYTGWLGLKYIALGDILIVLTFGPVIVLFSYLSQTGHLSLAPIIYSIPQVLNIEAILHSNNARDMNTDREAGVLTLAILLGPTGSYLLFLFLLFTPCVLFLTIGIYCCPWMLLPASSIFLAFPLENEFRKGNLKLMPHKLAKLNLVLGILYIIAIFVAQPTSLAYL